ncbi:hypothetical protein BKA70DRAFT_1246361 [Coprinopsis sp. MPI-PUGE-AT-0042]|nr:hypothetical protein BKA70DRAFT_1246361 [Coprinopsis sp. MPI-PUGE-AT-0042]
MRRPILLRLFLALGAARYSRAFGFSSGNYETDFYRRYDFPPEEPSVDNEGEEVADVEVSVGHDVASTDRTSRDPATSSTLVEPHIKAPTADHE